MCGIAGFVVSGQGRVDRTTLKRMCDRLQHRGPDAYGAYCDDRVALGHRRLSIIDVSGGDQPIGNEDGTIQVVFNGEIYNYQDLKRELAGKGHRFATNSDTEVLVHLYEEVGERLPQFLNGMFAFAIWDSRRGELFLARDRMGKKPLYYSLNVPGLWVCFASELKALTILPGFDAAVNSQAVADFLCFSYVPDPDTIYRSANKLAPGHSLTITPDGNRPRRYWAPEMSIGRESSLPAIAGELSSVAANAVTCRMISEVPLGAFLSGGIDSSAVVALMARATSDPVSTFSIGFTTKSLDERSYARTVAEKYGTHHREFEVSPQISDVLDMLVEHYDEPFGDASAIPTLYLSRLTRQHVTVALSGDGADEVFGGYMRYQYCAFDERLRALFPKWFRDSIVKVGARYYPSLGFAPRVFRAKSLLTRLSQELADGYFKWMSAFPGDTADNVYSEDLKRELNGYSARRRFTRRFEAVAHLSPLQQMQAVDMDTYLPGDILVKVDRASMAYSLEARCPWLDHRLVELANRLPVALKIRAGQGKYAFRSAMAELLPQQTLARKKMGFAVPLAQWFRTSLRSVFEAMVFRPEMEAYVSMPEVRRLWLRHQSGAEDNAPKLWNILMLALWDSRHLRQEFTSTSEALLMRTPQLA